MLEQNWAYGSNHALKGKKITLIITAGGSLDSYQYNQSYSKNIEAYMYGFYEMIRTLRADYLDTFYIFEANSTINENRLSNEYGKYFQFIKEITTNN